MVTKEAVERDPHLAIYLFIKKNVFVYSGIRYPTLVLVIKHPNGARGKHYLPSELCNIPSCQSMRFAVATCLVL